MILPALRLGCRGNGRRTRALPRPVLILEVYPARCAKRFGVRREAPLWIAFGVSGALL